MFRPVELGVFWQVFWLVGFISSSFGGNSSNFPLLSLVLVSTLYFGLLELSARVSVSIS